MLLKNMLINCKNIIRNKLSGVITVNVSKIQKFLKRAEQFFKTQYKINTVFTPNVNEDFYYHLASIWSTD